MSTMAKLLILNACPPDFAKVGLKQISTGKISSRCFPACSLQYITLGEFAHIRQADERVYTPGISVASDHLQVFGTRFHFHSKLTDHSFTNRTHTIERHPLSVVLPNGVQICINIRKIHD